MVTKYCVVFSFDSNALTVRENVDLRVQALLDKRVGWKPHGGVCVSASVREDGSGVIYMAQSMICEEDLPETQQHAGADGAQDGGRGTRA